MIEMLQLKRQAVDQLINQKLMLLAAAELKLDVSDQELAESIRQIEAFQSDGVFDPRRYQYVLSRSRLSEELFESQQRNALLIGKVQDIATDNIKVSDLEAEQWFAWYRASVDVDYVQFSPNRYQQIEPSQDEVEAHFKDHQSDYKTEEQVKARYIRFSPDTYQAGIDIDEEEIKEYFEANPEEFRTDKTVEARHILIKVAENASTDEVNETRSRAIDVMKMARDGRDFAELAKKYSEGPSKDRGGHLGAFKKEAMVEPFAERAFSMQAGEISEPVRTQFGWHVIKVEKINEASNVAYPEARVKIRQKLVEDRAKTMAYDDAVDIYDASFEGDDLIRAAEQRRLTVHKTERFTRSTRLEDIADSDAFISAAFNLVDNEISDILDLPDGYYILQVIEKIPPQIPQLNDVFDRVQADVVKEMQLKKAKAEADAFILELKNGESFGQTCAKFTIEPKNTGFFRRNEPVPDIGYDDQYTQAAFKLTRDAPFTDQAIKSQKGFYVISLRDRKVPSNTDFLAEKEAVKKRLLQQKQLNTIDAWLSELRSNSEVSIDQDLIE
jgi:peptidyl-prolyl cis-trans isomerase D